MRIAHVGVEVVPAENGAFVGGLVKNVATLSAEQVRRGHDVHLFTTDINGRLPEGGRESYGTIHRIPVTGAYGSVRFAMSFLRGAARALLREQGDAPFDIVHAHSAYASFALLGRRIEGLPAKKVFSLYSPNLRFLPGHDCNNGGLLRGKWLTVSALRGFDAVVVPSQNLETRLRAESLAGVQLFRVGPLLDPAMLKDLPSREEARRALDLPSDRPVLLFLGNYSPWKGVEVLLQALEEVRAKHPDLLLLTAWGEPYEWSGNNRTEILAQVERLHLQPILRQIGIVGDVRLALRAADVLVSPFLCTCKVLDDPLSILEGMACGVPVVGSRVGGIPEILGEDRRGLCIPPGDAAALSAALNKLLSNPSEARRLADEAWTWVRANFRADTIADEMDQVYGKLLAPKPVGPPEARAA